MKKTIKILAGDIIPKRLGWRCEAVADCHYINDSMTPRQRFGSDVFTKEIEVSFERILKAGAESNGLSGCEYTFAVYEPQHTETNPDYVMAIRKLVMQDEFQRMLNDEHNSAV